MEEGCLFKQVPSVIKNKATTLLTRLFIYMVNHLISHPCVMQAYQEDAVSVVLAYSSIPEV